MFGVLTVQLWRGFTQLRHGELPAAEESLRAGIEQITPARWRHPRLRPRAALLDPARAGSDRRGGGGATCHRTTGRRSGTGRCSGDPPRSSSCWRREAGRRRSPPLAPMRSSATGGPTRPSRRPSPSRGGRWRCSAASRRPSRSSSWSSSGRRRGAHPDAIGRTLRNLGQVRGADGAEELDRAVELLEGSPMRLDLAKAHFAVGMAARRDRRPSEARDTAAARFRAGRGLRGDRARGGDPHRAARHRRPAAKQRSDRPGVPDAVGAAGRRSRRRGSDEQGDRPDPLRDSEDRRGPPLEHLPQAGDQLEARAFVESSWMQGPS